MAELEKRSGLRRAVLWSIENGKGRDGVTLRSLERLATGFGVPCWSLLRVAEDRLSSGETG
jgi:transcriptional regulator with XRE-family HTH domain